ncbi:unnamed protein product [Symbiodinium sp. CCMP2592]|nr:unnamed protein product [Symbiodinium sp. CCMP2592]
MPSPRKVSRGKEQPLQVYNRGDSWCLEDRTSDGFQSHQELSNWDVKLLQPLLKNGALRLAQHNLSSGVIYYSDFSGYDAPRECLRVLRDVLQRMQPDQEPFPFHCVRACDVGRVQQDVLLQQSESLDANSSCVFANLQDRLPLWAAEWIHAVVPAGTSSLEAAAKANKDILEFLLENRCSILDATTKCHCLVHDRPCPVYPRLLACQEHSEGSVSEQREQSVRSQTLGAAWWEDPPWTRKPLAMTAAGLVCTDYSVLGKQRRGAGVNEWAHHLWHVDRLRAAELGAESCFFSECAALYPVEQKQAEAMAVTHHVVFVRCSPHDLGFPVRRRRTFSAGLCREEFVWCGPTDPSDVQELWDTLFKTSCVLTGDAFLAASESEVQAWMEARLKSRKHQMPPGCEACSVESLLGLIVAPGAVARKRKYDALREDRMALDGTYLCDLDHNPGFGPLAGPLFPAMDTHPNIFSYRKERLALPLECFAAQGLDMFPSLSGDRGPSPLKPILASLPDPAAKLLVGNSIHVPSFLCWMVFVLGNCCRRSEITGPPSAFPQSSTAEDDATNHDEPSEQVFGSDREQSSRRRAVLRL